MVAKVAKVLVESGWNLLLKMLDLTRKRRSLISNKLVIAKTILNACTIRFVFSFRLDVDAAGVFLKCWSSMRSFLMFRQSRSRLDILLLAVYVLTCFSVKAVIRELCAVIYAPNHVQ